MSKQLGELRIAIETELRKLDGASKWSISEAVKALLDNHSRIIQKCEKELQKLGLENIVRQVRGRRMDAAAVEQGELFSYPGLPRSIPVPAAEGQRRKRFVGLLNATVREARLWLQAAPPMPRATREAAVATLLQEIGPYVASDDMTIREALLARADAVRKSAKRP
jgi:hypothetical protein